MGLTDRKASRCKLEAFMDPSYAEGKENRYCVSRIVTKFGESTLSWLSRTQACVTLMSLEAECLALADCVKDVSYLKMLLGFLHPMPRHQSARTFLR